MSEPNWPGSSDLSVGSVVESFLARFRKGERPALTDLIASHPDLAAQLREIIPALVELEHFGDLTGTYHGPRSDRVSPSASAHPVSLGGYRVLARIGAGAWGWSMPPSTSRSRAAWRSR